MFRRTLIAAAVAASLTTSAQATILLYSYYLQDFNYDTTTPKPVLVPLSSTSQDRDTLLFTVPTTARVKITFSAECLIRTDSQGLAWVDIDIIIDGNLQSPVPPTSGSSDAFCGDGRNFQGPAMRLSRAAITVAPLLAAGKHSIAIVAKLSTNASSQGRDSGGISQSTLLIEQ